jgi:CDP-glycerol glycerophosphotransferase (TagB/SpsB family)
MSPWVDRYVVQNQIMKDDVVRYHGIDPDRVTVTGWPQSDVFAVKRPLGQYQHLLRELGLDPWKKVVMFAGNTPTNAPLEGRLVERLMSWWRETGAPFSLLFRPHPRDRHWKERYAAAFEQPGVRVQEPSYTDIESLALLLQHADVVVANAGTVLLDALVNDRPAVCVLFDEGADEGERYAALNVVGRHYRELAASGAYEPAGSFEEIVAGIARCLTTPGELSERRRAIVARVVGDVDGGAAERVVDALVELADGSGGSRS